MFSVGGRISRGQQAAQLGALGEKAGTRAHIHVVGQRQQTQPVFGLRGFVQRVGQAFREIRAVQRVIRPCNSRADFRCVQQQRIGHIVLVLVQQAVQFDDADAELQRFFPKNAVLSHSHTSRM